MSLRTHYIGFLPFAGLQSRATQAQEEAKEAKLREEFLKLVPATRRMVATELILQRLHVPTGCMLEYHLVERPRRPFDFTGGNRGPSATGKQVGGFDGDVQAVVTECQSVKTRLTLAASPGWDAGALRADTQVAVDARGLRSLHHRKANTIVLPSPEGGLSIQLPQVPKLLPTGSSRTITASVSKMEKGFAMLEHVKLVTAPGEQMELEQLPETLPLRRPPKRLRDASALLLDAMDAGKPLQLTVVVALCWISAQPLELGLVSALPAASRRPRARSQASALGGQREADLMR